MEIGVWIKTSNSEAHFLVDKDIYERIKFKACSLKFNGHRMSIQIWMHNRQFELGRYILNCLDPQLQVDHKDRVTLNFLRTNLRIANKEQNASNKSSTNLTSYKGVTKKLYATSGIRYQSRIQANHTNYNLGTYLTAKEAAAAYDKAAIKYHGKFACTNFTWKLADGEIIKGIR